jgi:hypothetical protein
MDQLGSQQAVVKDGRLVDEGVGDGFERRPKRRLTQLSDDVVRDADEMGLEVLDGISATSGLDQLAEPGRMVGGPSRRASVDHKRQLMDDELGDRQAVRRRLQGEDGARRIAEHRGGAPGLGDDREILDLALDDVRQRVAAVAPATPIVGVQITSWGGAARRR